MTETKDAGPVRRLEEAITRIRGIRRARVDPNTKGSPSVRVLVVPERASAEIVEQVQDVVLKEGGRRILPEAIEVLHSGHHPPDPWQRRRLSSISTERTTNRFKARVVVELGGDTLEGESESPNQRSFEFRSVARATLISLTELLPHRVELDTVDMHAVGAHELAVVAVSHSEGPLVGSALVRIDHHDAIARATLDAVNRLVTPLRGGGSR